MLKPSQTYTFDFSILSSTGALADADSLPTAVLSVNGTNDAATVTITNKSTGRYKGSVTIPAGCAAGDNIDINISATVGGVATGDTHHAGIVDTKRVSDLKDEAMRGTDGANTTTPPTTAQIKTALEAAGSHLAQILEDTGTSLPAMLGAITQASRLRIIAPHQMERPDSDSTTYRIYIYAYDAEHVAEDLDGVPTVTIANNTQTDRSANLGTVTKDTGTGIYYVDYTVASDHAIEGLVIKVNATEGGVTTQYAEAVWVTDVTAVDFTAADRSKLEAINSKMPTGNVADQTTAAAVLEDTGTTLPATLAGLATAANLAAAKSVADAINTIVSSGVHGNAALKAIIDAILTDTGTTLDTNLLLVLAILQGDWSVDTAATPWQIVCTHKTTHAELIRKDMKDVSGTGIAATTTVVGQTVEPA